MQTAFKDFQEYRALKKFVREFREVVETSEINIDAINNAHGVSILYVIIHYGSLSSMCLWRLPEVLSLVTPYSRRLVGFRHSLACCMPARVRQAAW